MYYSSLGFATFHATDKEVTAGPGFALVGLFCFGSVCAKFCCISSSRRTRSNAHGVPEHVRHVVNIRRKQFRLSSGAQAAGTLSRVCKNIWTRMLRLVIVL